MRQEEKIHGSWILGTNMWSGVGGGGVSRGILEIFLRKKSWPSHFPEWINAWPFTNAYTKTSDPTPTSSKNNRKWK